MPTMKREVFSIAEGEIFLEWPAIMSPEEYQDFMDWLAIIERKMARAALESERTGKAARSLPETTQAQMQVTDD